MNKHSSFWVITGAAWLLALSCNFKPSGEIETRGRGTHPPRPSGEGTDVVEQWVTATAVAREMTAGTMDRVQSIMGVVQSARLEFVNCDAPPCVGRFQAPNLADARALLKSISDTYQGRIGYSVRERLDAYTGQSFQLDVALDTDQIRPLPDTDEALVTDE